ncbi:MAG: ABC transporter ATP-binding protein [Acidimicrobiia bacterium]
MQDQRGVPLLECDGLVRRFGERTAVAGLSLHIDRGETYGLLGPNGSGKTTTISMIAGVLRPDAGTITVGGLPMGSGAGSARAKALIGLVPQDIALYEDLTARENLAFFGRLQGMGGTELQRRSDEVLDVVGLRDRAGDRIADYSGGMKRRANIAVGLLHRPQLLILDEPTVGVDPQSRNQILTAIEALGGAGLAVLYTTHYMEEAERLCRRVGIIDAGVMIAEGTRRELVARIGEHDVVTLELNAGDAELDAFAGRCATLAGVVDVRRRGERTVEVLTDAPDAALPAVIAAATSAGLALQSATVREPNLEAVFLHLTGRALRD